jgi:hypothetical protein
MPLHILYVLLKSCQHSLKKETIFLTFSHCTVWMNIEMGKQFWNLLNQLIKLRPPNNYSFDNSKFSEKHVLNIIYVNIQLKI